MSKLSSVTKLMALAIVFGLVSLSTAAEPKPGNKSPRPARRAPDPALVPIEDVAGLPRVLLIGDSISMGYTLPVRELLKGKANVHHPPENCGDTSRGLAQLDKWLGDKKWDVIHFNFGLHDLKYLDAQGKLVPPDQGKQVAPLAQYEANLREIGTRLKKTGAKIIWCSTTPVPDGSPGRVKDSERAYNAVAAKVAGELGLAVDDQHAVAEARLAEIQRPQNVHFTPDGSKVLAQAVVESIKQALAQ